MVNSYEDIDILSEYLLFHYAEDEVVLPYKTGPHEALQYPRRCAEDRLQSLWEKGFRPKRALDVGCAVGGSSFALAGHCEKVVGIDYSAQFIAAADALRAGKALSIDYKIEGDRRETLKILPPEQDLRQRVRFERGDAMNLKPDLGSFDLVIAINLICRLSHPSRFLERLATLVEPGGYFLLNTPHSWLAEFTPKEEWPGNKEELPAQEALDQSLAQEFELIDREDMPFLIREHARKYQFTYAASSLYRRRG